jgi:hypothetical protein
MACGFSLGEVKPDFVILVSTGQVVTAVDAYDGRGVCDTAPHGLLEGQISGGVVYRRRAVVFCLDLQGNVTQAHRPGLTTLRFASPWAEGRYGHGAIAT